MTRDSVAYKPVFSTPTTTAVTHGRSIEVLSLDPGQTPDVLAVVAVRVGGIVINEISVTNRGGSMIINYPARKVGDRWIDFVEIKSPALHRAVAEVILLAVREMDGER